MAPVLRQAPYGALRVEIVDMVGAGYGLAEIEDELGGSDLEEERHRRGCWLGRCENLRSTRGGYRYFEEHPPPHRRLSRAIRGDWLRP
jgi:hypothetical protein